MNCLHFICKISVSGTLNDSTEIITDSQPMEVDDTAGYDENAFFENVPQPEIGLYYFSILEHCYNLMKNYLYFSFVLIML